MEMLCGVWGRSVGPGDATWGPRKPHGAWGCSWRGDDAGGAGVAQRRRGQERSQGPCVQRCCPPPSWLVGPPPPSTHPGVMPNPGDHRVVGTGGSGQAPGRGATEPPSHQGHHGHQWAGKESESPWLLLRPGCCHGDPNKASAPSFWLSFLVLGPFVNCFPGQFGRCASLRPRSGSWGPCRVAGAACPSGVGRGLLRGWEGDR